MFKCDPIATNESGPLITRVRDPRSKSQHIDACLSNPVEYQQQTGFERYAFVSQALPELCMDDIDLTTSLAGKRLAAPLMIAPMTGGDERCHEINKRLARAAERWQIAMGVGSQRIAIEDPDRAKYFRVRNEAPTTLIFANIGGEQLVNGWGVDQARRAIDMIEADALFIHLNAIQEAIQSGSVSFKGLAKKIEHLCSALQREGTPVFVREVCFGLSQQAVMQLIECGVSGIDCAGAGGTSWAKVEAACAKNKRRKVMGGIFGEWGIPTKRSIDNVRSISTDIPLVATGGLRSGVDVAKALALGADIGAMARPFLLQAHKSEELLDEWIADLLTELRICMFGIGATNLDALKAGGNLIDSLSGEGAN